MTLPAVGTALDAGQALGEVESTKSVSDVYAPVAGTVTATNEALDANPELVNSDPYGEGWLLEMSVDGGEEALQGTRCSTRPRTRPCCPSALAGALTLGLTSRAGVRDRLTPE